MGFRLNTGWISRPQNAPDLGAPIQSALGSTSSRANADGYALSTAFNLQPSAGAFTKGPFFFSADERGNGPKVQKTIDIPSLVKSLAQADDKTLEAFQVLHSHASLEEGSPAKDEAIAALRTMTLDKDSWKTAAENTDIESAEAYWEVMGMMGLIYENASARAAFAQVNLKPYALHSHLNVLGRGETLPLLWTGMARLWGNDTLDTGMRGAVFYKLETALFRFARTYHGSSPALFDEGSYQESLAGGTLLPDNRKIHDALVALAKNPGQSKKFTEEVEGDLTLASHYVGFQNSIIESLNENGKCEMHPWVTTLAARVLQDDVLASTHAGLKLAIVMGDSSQIRSMNVAWVARSLRGNIDHQLRFLVFLMMNEGALELTEEGIGFVFNLGDIFERRNVSEILEVLEAIQPSNRRLKTAAAVCRFRKHIRGMKDALKLNLPEIFLSQKNQRILEGLLEILRILRTKTWNLLNFIDEETRTEFQNAPTWQAARMGFIAMHLATSPSMHLGDVENFGPFRRTRDEWSESNSKSKIEANLHSVRMGLNLLFMHTLDAVGFTEEEGLDLIMSLTDIRIFDHTGDAINAVIDAICQAIAEKIQKGDPETPSPTSMLS